MDIRSLENYNYEPHTATMEVTRSNGPIFVECSKTSPHLVYAVESEIIILQHDDIYNDEGSSSIKFEEVSRHSFGVQVLDMDIQSLNELPFFGLCIAGFNGKLEFTKHTNNDVESINLTGHKGHVNSCKFFLNNYNIMCSTGDDNTLKIWDLQEKGLISTISLKSPGVVVDVHKDMESCVLVAEKSGSIKIFDLRSNTVVNRIFFDEPLLSAEWCQQNKNEVIMGSGNRWKRWRMENEAFISEGACGDQKILSMRYSNVSDIFGASDGSDSLYIWSNSRKEPEIKYLPKGSNATNISWLYNADQQNSTLVAGANKYLYFFSMANDRIQYQ